MQDKTTSVVHSITGVVLQSDFPVLAATLHSFLIKNEKEGGISVYETLNQ